MSSPPTDSQETKRLLEQASGGDREAFDRLFELHRKAIKKLVSLRMDPLLKRRLDPSDIVQETQMVAFRRFDDFLKRRPMSFRLWLRKTAQQQVGLARRTHIERYRRSVLREETGLSRSSRLIARGLMSAAAASPSEKLARRELEQRVAVAIAQLSDADRETVIMRNVEGLNFEEIALVLDLNPPAVRQRYGRALIRLRAKLQGGRSKDSEL